MGELDLSRSDYTAARARGKFDEDRGYASRSSSDGYENAKAGEYGDMERRKGVSYAFQIPAPATSFLARNTAICCDNLEGDMDQCPGLTLAASCDRCLGSRGKAAE
jgi:hypothetical protein